MKLFYRVILLVVFSQSSLSYAITIPNLHTEPLVFTPTLKQLPTIVIPYNTVNPETYSVDAIKEFKNISKAEKKHRIKDAKLLLKEYKKQKKAGDDVSSNQVLMAILCVLLPPLAVYLHEKETNTKFWISVILSLLLWVPGIIYALLVVFDKV